MFWHIPQDPTTYERVLWLHYSARLAQVAAGVGSEVTQGLLVGLVRQEGCGKLLNGTERRNRRECRREEEIKAEEKKRGRETERQ